MSILNVISTSIFTVHRTSSSSCVYVSGKKCKLKQFDTSKWEKPRHKFKIGQEVRTRGTNFPRLSGLTGIVIELSAVYESERLLAKQYFVLFKPPKDPSFSMWFSEEHLEATLPGKGKK